MILDIDLVLIHVYREGGEAKAFGLIVVDISFLIAILSHLPLGCNNVLHISPSVVLQTKHSVSPYTTLL